MCSANRKGPTPEPAITLYRSEFFRLGRSYAHSQDPALLFVLSAKWGLLPADQVVAPYPEMMSQLQEPEVLDTWAEGIVQTLHGRLDPQRYQWMVLGLRRFAYPLAKALPHAKMPLDGMNFVQAINFLRREASV